MTNLVEMLVNNTYVQLFVIIGTIYSIYMSKQSYPKYELSYYKQTNKVISISGSHINSLRMTYKGEPITDISITKVAIWNSGTQGIEKKDIVNGRQLTLGVKENRNSKILDCFIKYRTDNTNDIKQDPIKNEKGTAIKYIFDFTYMARKDGFLLEIIHTGNVDDLYIDCYTKEGKDIIEIDKQGAVIRKGPKIAVGFQKYLKKIAVSLSEDLTEPLSWYQGFFIFGIYVFCGLIVLCILLKNYPFQFHAELVSNIAQIINDIAWIGIAVSLAIGFFGVVWKLVRIPLKLLKRL